MKKRLLSLLLAFVMVLGLLPAGRVFAGNAKTPLNLTYNTKSAPAAVGTLLTTAYVRNANITAAAKNGEARKIDIVVSLTDFNGPQSFFAIVMSAADYKAQIENKGGPLAAGLMSGNYGMLSASDTSRYGISRGNITGGELDDELKIGVVSGTMNNDKDQTVGSMSSSYLSLPLPGVTAGPDPHPYYDEYVYAVWRGGTTDTDRSYYVDHFYLDKDGYVLTPSYMVHYDGNNPTVGSGSVTGTPGDQIQRAVWNGSSLGTGAPGDMKLSTAKPTRTGYEFVGWTTDKRSPLAAGATLPTHVGDPNFYDARKSPSPDLFPEQATNSVTTIYALWQVKPVKFSQAAQTPYTISSDTSNGCVLDWKEVPQVGVALKTTTSVTYERPQKTGDTEPNGAKSFTIKAFVGTRTTAATAPLVASGATWNGLTIASTSGSDKEREWKLTGTPTNHSYNASNVAQEVWLEVTVKDASNDTTDTITIHFTEIKKRAQDKPDLDVNTGLQGGVDVLDGTATKLPADVETAKDTEKHTEDSSTHTAGDESALYGSGGFKDGKLYGFYSLGQPKATDIAGTQMNDNSGSLRTYYLTKGMIYEYRPRDSSVTDPEAGWREIPYPKSAYNTTTQLPTIESTMGYRATKDAYTDAKEQASAAINGVTATTCTAWSAKYGWIVWNKDGLPEVHGLTPNEVYEVRFRSNSKASASDVTEVVIAAGGGAAPSGSSTGVHINKAGGDWPATAEDRIAGQAFVDYAKTVSPNSNLTLHAIEPVREGYKFLGWTLDTWEGTGDSKKLLIYRYQTSVTWKAEDGGVLKGPVTTHLVDGEAPDGLAPEPRQYAVGSSTPEDPTKEFDTWEKSTALDGSLTYTAKYKAKQTYTYKFTDTKTVGAETFPDKTGNLTPEPGPNDFPTPKDYTDNVTDSANPVKMYFEKWQKKAAATKAAKTAAPATEVEYEAVYKNTAPTVYIWKYKTAGATESDPEADKEITLRSWDATAPACPLKNEDVPSNKAGAPFKAWGAGVDGTDAADSAIKTVTYTAEYEPELTFQWKDAGHPLPIPDTKGYSAVLPNYPTTPADYDDTSKTPAEKMYFKGWQLDGTNSTATVKVYDAVYDATPPTVYIWKFKTAGATESDPEQEISYPLRIWGTDIPPCPLGNLPPNKAGAPFEKWSAGVDGTDAADPAIKTVTYTAEYKAAVTYKWYLTAAEVTDAGATPHDTKAAPEKPADPGAPYRPGFSFKEWALDEENSTDALQIYVAVYEELSYKISCTDTVPIGTLPASLAAVWESTGGSGGLTINLAGGKWANDTDKATAAAYLEANKAVTVGGTIPLSAAALPVPVRATYEFAGWTFADDYAAGTGEAVLYAPKFDTDGKLVGYTLNGADVTSARVSTGGAGLAAVWNATTEGVLAVTCYDWDNTMLGTFIFRSNSNPATQLANAQAAMRDFAARPDVKQKLEGKPGYDFLSWVKNDPSVPTSYGKRVDSADMYTVLNLDLNPADATDFATLTNSVAVKAAYTTNNTIIDETVTKPERDYKTTVVGYARFGIGNSYSIQVKVERGNVPRLTEGYLRVKMVIAGADVYSRIKLSGADTEVLEIVPYASSATTGVLTGVSLVEWTVIDSYQLANWVGAGERTDTTVCRSTATFAVKDVLSTATGTTKTKAAVWDKESYPMYGSIKAVYDALVLRDTEGTSPGILTAANMRMLGIAVASAANATLRNGTYDRWVALGKPELDYDTLYKIVSGT